MTYPVDADVSRSYYKRFTCRSLPLHTLKA